MEQLWEDNRLTFEGSLLHERVDNPSYRAKSGNILTIRSVKVASKELGIYGIMDMLEYHPTEHTSGLTHPLYPGKWQPFPVEYKHGRPKKDNIDEVQLVAQALCLEEMYGIEINHGAFFYAATQHRHEVEFTQELKDLVKSVIYEMHSIFASRNIPKARYSQKCKNCSLLNICLPQLTRLQDPISYINDNLYEETS